MKTRFSHLAGVLLLLSPAVLHATTFTVSTTADEFDTPSGASVSLREALRDAETASGPDTILFAPTLSGQTIVLGSEIAITDPGAVTMDASSLSSRLVIDGGPGNNRIFYVGGSATVSIVAVKLMGGNGSGSVDPNVGGVAFNNGGSLTLTLCAMINNSAGAGGARFTTTTPRWCWIGARSPGTRPSMEARWSTQAASRRNGAVSPETP